MPTTSSDSVHGSLARFLAIKDTSQFVRQCVIQRRRAGASHVCDAHVLKKNSTIAGRKCFVQQRRAGASHMGDARVSKKNSTVAGRK